MSNKKIRFASGEHQAFFLEMMRQCRVNDSYHQAFFYVMGIAPETRANIGQMLDFKHDWIMPEGDARRLADQRHRPCLPAVL